MPECHTRDGSENTIHRHQHWISDNEKGDRLLEMELLIHVLHQMKTNVFNIPFQAISDQKKMQWYEINF